MRWDGPRYVFLPPAASNILSVTTHHSFRSANLQTGAYQHRLVATSMQSRLSQPSSTIGSSTSTNTARFRRHKSIFAPTLESKQWKRLLRPASLSESRKHIPSRQSGHVLVCVM